MSHPGPTYDNERLFVSGSYGANLVSSANGLAIAPKEGWAILQVIQDAVLSSITFGGDVSGGSKLVGPTLLAGTTVWAHIMSVEVASGLVELRRGRENVEGVASVGTAAEVEATSYTETYVDGSKVIVNWTEPGVSFVSGHYDIYRDGILIESNIPSGTTAYEDMSIVSGTTYTYVVMFIYLS